MLGFDVFFRRTHAENNQTCLGGFGKKKCFDAMIFPKRPPFDVEVFCFSSLVISKRRERGGGITFVPFVTSVPFPVCLFQYAFSVYPFSVYFQCTFSVYLFGVPFWCTFSVYLFSVPFQCTFQCTFVGRVFFLSLFPLQVLRRLIVVTQRSYNSREILY